MQIRIFFKQPSAIPYIDVEDPAQEINVRFIGSIAKADGAFFNAAMFIPYENILMICKVDPAVQTVTIHDEMTRQ